MFCCFGVLFLGVGASTCELPFLAFRRGIAARCLGVGLGLGTASRRVRRCRWFARLRGARLVRKYTRTSWWLGPADKQGGAGASRGPDLPRAFGREQHTLRTRSSAPL